MTLERAALVQVSLELCRGSHFSQISVQKLRLRSHLCLYRSTTTQPGSRRQQSIARRCKRVRVRACASSSGDSQIDLGISGNQHKNCIVFSIKWYNKSSIPPFPVSPPSETLRCNQAGEEVFTFMHTLKLS